ncbi:MAG: hypothetical protein JNJ98_18985 [Gemmatimonadetes bacterium]|nr:hypothetical protein [Gemmatimonadota bacterium]
MLDVVMEGVLVVALVAACGALLFFVVMSMTPLGRRWREERRARPVREAGPRCPVHGPLREEEMVQLPSGERVCPRCVAETIG